VLCARKPEGLRAHPRKYVISLPSSLAQTAALDSHPYILEDGRQLPKVSGSHADGGEEVLGGMYAEGCRSIEESRITEQSGSTGRQVSAARVRSGPAGIVSKEPRIVPT
jgi:hypothetical protein